MKSNLIFSMFAIFFHTFFIFRVENCRWMGTNCYLNISSYCIPICYQFWENFIHNVVKLSTVLCAFILIYVSNLTLLTGLKKELHCRATRMSELFLLVQWPSFVVLVQDYHYCLPYMNKWSRDKPSIIVQKSIVLILIVFEILLMVKVKELFVTLFDRCTVLFKSHPQANNLRQGKKPVAIQFI